MGKKLKDTFSDLNIKRSDKVLLVVRAVDALVFLSSFKDCKITMIIYGNKTSVNIATQNIKKSKFSEVVEEIYTVKQFLNGELNNMKPDFVLGNPPYQTQVGPNKTQQIWAKLTTKFFGMLVNDGKMYLLHPGGWRRVLSSAMADVKNVNEIYTTNKILSMELNDYKKGKEVFGVITDYDAVLVQKTKSNGDVTIKNRDGEYKTNITDTTLIPTANMKIFEKLRARDGEEKIELLYSRSAYGTDKKHISKTKDKTFKYPCVTGMPLSGLSCVYSNTNQNGHFGIPKIIISRASTYTTLDTTGEYGLAQFSYGLVDTVETLPKIQKILDNPLFQKLMTSFIGRTDKNVAEPHGSSMKFMKEFRKDFWKDLPEYLI